MGTHPIFESDFDCLTEMLRLCVRVQRRQIALVNHARVAGTVLDSSNEHRQFLLQTNTLKVNDHVSHDVARTLTVKEQMFVTILNEDIALPRAGDRVTVNGITKVSKFCDSSLVPEGVTPQLEQSLSRVEVYARDFERGAEEDINHVVLSGFINKGYEMTRYKSYGELGTHGLVKCTSSRGEMFFITDCLMTNSRDRFPHNREVHHQYVNNRKIIVPNLRRQTGKKQKGKEATAASNYILNLPFVATCCIANVNKNEQHEEDDILQSRLFCMSLGMLSRENKAVIGNDELYSSNFKFLPASEEIVFPDSDSAHRELGTGWKSDEMNLSDEDRAVQRDIQKLLERVRQ